MDIKFRLAAGILLAVGLLLPESALAFQNRGNSGTNVWKFLSDKYDKDKDGKLTKQEYNRNEETFAKFDRNEDGVLSAADWEVASNRSRSRGNRSDSSSAPKVGDTAPDFELAFVKQPEKNAKLSSFAGDKPVALIFGSCT